MFYIVRADAIQIDLIGAFATHAAALAFAEADLGPDLPWQVIGPCRRPPPVQHIAPPAAPKPRDA